VTSFFPTVDDNNESVDGELIFIPKAGETR
jgi:hypothetical protein